MNPTGESSSTKFGLSPSMRHILRIAALLIVIALLFEAFQRLNLYGEKVVKREVVLLPVKIQLINPPSFLDQAILNRILQITGELAGRDQATFARFQDPLDSSILRDIAQQYAALPQKLPDGSYRHEYTAWIKQITFVRRVTDTAKKEERIEIGAEFRQPAALIAQGDSYYLVDADLVRLPGIYHDADVKAMSGLLVLSHIDEELPDPGRAWKSEEAKSGLALAQLLQSAPYAPQIASINLSNYGARVDKFAPQITLDTAWGTSVWWGRPVGTESYYEVASAAKLKALESVFLHYSRIDASRAYVDIRFEQVKVPANAASTDKTAGSISLEDAPRHG